MHRQSPHGRKFTPSLTSEHFQFAQSIQASEPSTATSSFLTPLLPSPQILSPPPRQEGHDYFDVHGRYEDAQNHHKKDKSNQKERTLIKQPTPAPNSTGCQTLSMASICNDCENPVPEMMSNHPPLKRDQYRSNHHTLEKTTHRNMRHANMKPPRNISLEDDDIVDSPAANALRKFSPRQSTNIDINSQKLRRTSTALYKRNNFHISRTSTMDVHISSRDINSRGACPQENNDPSYISTPQSIILRKASSVLVPHLPRSSMSGSLSHEEEGMRDPNLPTSELLAFYSTLTGKEGRHPPSDLQSRGTNAVIDSGSLSRKSSLPGHAPRAKQYGVLAAAATTYADVHVAPGTFELAQKSRRVSSAAGDQRPRRISVVHFRSRDSVYEVVWREDEITSGSSLATSSRTSSSPKQDGCTLRSLTPSSERKTNLSRQGQFPSLCIETTSSYLSDRQQDDLSQWSWAGPTPLSSNLVQQNERKKRRPYLIRVTNASNPDLTRPQWPSFVLNLPYGVKHFSLN